MAVIDEFSFSQREFSGRARLMPLPNLVLFPHVMQPLHVFEPRYRELLGEALGTDRLMTMAMLAPGWQKDYEGRPPLLPVACLGRVVVSYQLSSGASNVLVLGLKRVRLLRELPPRKKFREAEVEILEDYYPPQKGSATAALQRKLRNAFLHVLPYLPQVAEQLDQLLAGGVSLGTLTDIISYMLDIGAAQKEALLAEADVHRRSELLLSHLAAIATDDSPGAAGAIAFPPEFSAN